MACSKYSFTRRQKRSFRNSRLIRSILLGVLAVSFILFWFHDGQGALPPLPLGNARVEEPKRIGKGRLHLLIPATSANEELCKLLLSAQILGYPTPVLINYGDHENSTNPYAQHITKVEGILRYLEGVELSEVYDEDLVLIVDGYDLWLQLRPDVLIKRFYSVNEEANARAIQLYGEKLFRRNDIRQTILFGPDKICWPVDFSRPACWAVPESTMKFAFGPIHSNDRSLNDARWLNSGTVMGPVKDMIAVFRATLSAIQTEYTTDSDQFYFANIYGLQEYARLRLKPKLLKAAKTRVLSDPEDQSGGLRYEPRLKRGVQTEYHIGIDYRSELFQTLAFWKQHLVWTRTADAWRPPNGSKFPANSPYDITLPDDIQQSLPPFEALKYEQEAQEQSQPSWSEVPLNYNVVTRQFPVAIHVTGNPQEKNFRRYWWHKTWYQAQGERLRLASLKSDQQQISTEPIAGMFWFNAEGGEDADEIASRGKGGVWTDRRGWLSWKRVCNSAKEELFLEPDEDAFHAPMATAEPKVQPSSKSWALMDFFKPSDDKPED